MKAWRRAIFGVVVTIVGLPALALLLLYTGPPVPDEGPPIFELDEIRTLAGSEGPLTARAARISAGRHPRALLQVGAEWTPTATPVYAVVLEWPGSSMVLEPGPDAECSKDFFPTDDIDPGAYERMQRAMLRADAILATHEHFDHLCGLIRSPYVEHLAPKARITREQLEGHARNSVIDKRARALFAPFDIEPVHRLAPGVVLIKAPGHTPGSLWIYVRMRDGLEWLFVGDTVWTYEAIERGLSKPWLAALGVGERPWMQGRNLRFLMDLAAHHPEVRILVAHDEATWEGLLSRGEMAPL